MATQNLTIAIEGYKATEIRFMHTYNGFNVFQGKTTKTNGKKEVAVYVNQKGEGVRVATVQGMTQNVHESYTISEC